jgi:hypothetical protein
MPTRNFKIPELSTQDKTFATMCALLVTSYVGFVITSRRQLKKSLEESSAQYRETSEKIAEIIEMEKQKLSDR